MINLCLQSVMMTSILNYLLQSLKHLKKDKNPCKFNSNIYNKGLHIGSHLIKDSACLMSSFKILQRMFSKKKLF